MSLAINTLAINTRIAQTPPVADTVARLREGIDTPSQWRATRLLRPASLRLMKGGRSEQEALPEILAELRNNNRTRSTAIQRLEEAETLAAALWREARELLAQQGRDRRGLPERPVQSAKLDQLKSCISELISAYQLALADAFGAEGKEPDQSTLSLSALRILEWTWVEFDLYRLRYQPVPGASWQRINRVYFALLGRSIPDEPLPALTAPDFLTDQNACAWRAGLYLALQSLGLFDVFSWPKANQTFIARYCALIPDAVKRIQGNAPGQYIRFVHAEQAGPPSLTASEAGHHGMTLDFGGLAGAIRADQQAFFRREAGGTRSPERLNALPPAARRPGIRLLARDLDNGAPSFVPDTAERDEVLYLGAGMTTIRSLLRQVFSRSPHSQSPSSQPQTRRDPLHQPAHLRTDGDPWRLVHHSARLWRIQTPGAQSSSTALSVGALVAFGVGGAGLARPRIGRVARILRTADVLQIDLQELASFAAPISVSPGANLVVQSSSSPVSADSRPAQAAQKDSGQLGQDKTTADWITSGSLDKGAAPRALLIYDDDFGWGVIMPPSEPFHEGDAIALRTRRSNVETRLRSLRDATEDFLLFQINPHDPHLGVPSYPRSHKARRRALTVQPRQRPIDSRLRPDSREQFG